jgi:hypothetical protein
MPAFDSLDIDSAVKDPRYVAAIDLIRRAGAREIQLRYDDVQAPIVWVATAGFSIIDGKPSARGKINAHQAGGGLDPLLAIFALCRACLDRQGKCTRCGRSTMFDETFDPQPLESYYCWRQWDPEMKTFRRSCEGDN